MTSYVVFHNDGGELTNPKAVTASSAREALRQVLDEVSHGDEDFEIINPHSNEEFNMSADHYVVPLQHLHGLNASWGRHLSF
jgi:hypothetical protein